MSHEQLVPLRLQRYPKILPREEGVVEVAEVAKVASLVLVNTVSEKLAIPKICMVNLLTTRIPSLCD